MTSQPDTSLIEALRLRSNWTDEFDPVTCNLFDEAADALEAKSTQCEAMRSALTPSAETKAAYIGEFHFYIDEQSDDAACEVSRKVAVPWTTIKEIMAAILARTTLHPEWTGQTHDEGDAA